MKKILLLLVILAALFTSCQKSDEYYLNSDSSKNNYLKGASLTNRPLAEIKECSIVQISYPVGIDNDVLQFTYNSSGDPVSITRTLGAHTGYPNYVFKYDDKKRLTDFVGVYNNNGAEFWHRYFYDSRGNIILDSGYIFPRISNGFPENAFTRQLTYYSYDNKQRIIKDSTVFSNAIPPVVKTYTYDSDGNKNGTNYDDKININRTNKIWMFLNKDYSVNNPYNAIGYNPTGLPTSVNFPSNGKSIAFLGNAYYKAEILYECNGNGNSNK
jgi:hypothetical protein